jgi:hypothetical protein
MRIGVRRTILPGIVLMLLMMFVPIAQGREHNGSQSADCGRSSTGAVPISDLGEAQYQGAQGGLYPGGVNSIPAEHEAIGLENASQIEPLGADGNPEPDGSIAVMSIGVSNTNQEFEDFMTIVEGRTAPSIVLVNAAQPGEPIVRWADPQGGAWAEADRALTNAGVTPDQVQAAWVKVPERIQTWDDLEPFPVDAETYRDQLVEVLRIAKDRYPNLRIAYLSSRIYGGYSTSAMPSPEPLAYENGFGVKWAIEQQIDGSSELNADTEAGPVVAPWIAWGPYLWADGTTPRSDGLTWECSDLKRDGTHPSQSGIRKVGVMLAEHFLSSPTAVGWFTSTGEPVELGDVPASARPGDRKGDRNDSDGAGSDRGRDSRPRSSTTIASSTTVTDGASDAAGGQEEATGASDESRSPSSASSGLVLGVSVLILVVALGVAGLILLRGRESD